mgnify:CR=1 FL=1
MSTIMLDQLTNQTLLEDMELDLQITRLKYRGYSTDYQWQKWIRE